MARRRGRMTRRSSFKRVAPDRGWVTNVVAQSIDLPDTSGNFFFPAEVLQYADIDGDPIDVKDDKSDWFVRRIIYDGYCQYRPDNLNSFPAAWVEQSIVVLTGLQASSMEAAAPSYTPLNAPSYDEYQRVLWTNAKFMSRATATWLSGGERLNVSEGGALNTQVFLNGIADLQGMEQHLDIKCTFGLRDNNGLYHCTGWNVAEPFYQPEAEGNIDHWGHWRFLVQKRRT